MTNNNNNVNNNSGNQTPHFDNLKAKLASKAATAAGGPAAGKAVDTLNKIRNNPNNNGYANNKRNRLEQAGSTSEKSSELDENNSNNTNQNNSNNPINKLGSMLGGNNSNKINENDSTATKAVKTVKKIKMIAPIIAALSPFIMSFLGLIIVVVIVISQFAAIENFVAEIKVGVEKMLNFTSGDGWVTNETAFFTRLKDENAKYQELSNNGENLDLALIAATIHYDRLVDPSVYEQNNIGNETYDEKTQNTAIVEKNQTASFYGVANSMLGKVDTILPGERRLLGHLVKTKITYTNFEKPEDAAKAWGNYFKQAGVSITEEICPNPLDLSCYVKKSSEFIGQMDSYARKYDAILAYLDFDILNKYYEAKEFMNGLSSGDANEEQKESGNWVPVVTREMDYESYKNYLRNVYIPFNYFYGAKKEDVDPLEVEKIVEEIFAQKDYYNYLFHPKVEDEIEGDYNSNAVCSYNIGSKNVSNVKVELLSCDGKKTLEVMDLEKYVMGVVYAEVDFDSSRPEQMKAQAIAARSYALNRKYNSNNNTIKIRSCTINQVYCDVEKGCIKKDYLHTNGKTYTETEIGIPSGVKAWKQPLGDEKIQKYKDILSAVTGKVVVYKNGKVMDTTYTNNTQEKWKEMEKQGKDYNEILVSHYSSSGNPVSIKSDCSAGGAKAGPWADWKQGGSSWSGIHLGKSSRTIGSAGCLVTSISIQIARSGTKINSSSFDPGVFVRDLNNNSGFTTDGNFRGTSYQKIVPNIVTDYYKEPSGNIASKAKTIKGMINDGCYVVLRVKLSAPKGQPRWPNEGQHWVAVVDVDENNNIYIVDPGGGPKGIHILNSKNHPKYNILLDYTTAFARCYRFKDRK